MIVQGIPPMLASLRLLPRSAAYLAPWTQRRAVQAAEQGAKFGVDRG